MKKGIGFFRSAPARQPTFQSVWDQFFLTRNVLSTYTLTTFKVAGDTGTGFNAGNFAVDINYQIRTNNRDPIVTIYEPGSWGDRDSGTTPLDTTHLPKTVIIPDVDGGDTPNNPAIVLNDDTRTAKYLNAATRPSIGGNIWGYIGGGFKSPHAGSGTAGGEVTLAELNTYINHALAINVYGVEYLSNTNGGFVSPALKADTGYDDSMDSNYYGGNLYNLKMGSWVAIPSSVSAASLGVTSVHGLALYRALVNYGAFIVDNTAWDAVAINATEDAAAALYAITTEALSLFTALRIVETTVFTPTDLSGLVLWLKSDTGITKDGSNLVSAWANQASTGSGYDAAQGTATNKPLWVNSAINGYPAIRFDGVDNFMSFSGSALDMVKNVPGITIVIVWKSANTGTVQDLFYAGNNTGVTSRIEIGKLDTGEDAVAGTRTDADSFNLVVNPSTTGTGYIVTTGIWDFTNNLMNIYRNGVFKATTTSAWSGGGNSSNTASFDMFFGKNGAGQYLNGDIVEMLVYQSALSNDNRNKVETYVLERYLIS